MAGLFSNPANWAITDTLQGQEGGWTLDNNWLGQTGTAAGSYTGSNSDSVIFSNPTGFTSVLGTNSTSQNSPTANDSGTDQPIDGAVYGSGTGGSSYDPADLAYLDDQKSLYERLLQSADATEQNGLSSIANQYTAGKNKANTQFGRAQTDFNQKEYETKYGKQENLNKVNANSRTLANSVRRLLGLAGASGGSAMGDANTAIAREASQNRSGVLSDYATNLGQLKTGRDRTQEDYDSLLGELDNQKRSSEESLKAGVLGQRQNIWNTLADIAAKRQALLGGDYNAVKAAQDPYRSSYLQAQDTIDKLPGQYQTAVAARDVSVAPVSLKDYFVNKTNINANQGGQQAYSPYSQFLNKKRQEEV